MKAVQFLEQTVAPDGMFMIPNEPEYTLNIAGIYQDHVTRGWAMQICRRATRVAGEERIQNEWFDVNSLSNHKILLNAVHAALAADVIVVSLYAAKELPLDLCVWFEAWMPRRRARAGALTALIGVTEPPDSQFARTLNYLQAMARKAQLDFVPQACKAASPIPGFTHPVDRGTTQRRGKTVPGSLWPAL